MYLRTHITVHFLVQRPAHFICNKSVHVNLIMCIDSSTVQLEITTAARQWYVGMTANQDGGYQCVQNELLHISLLLYIYTAI